MTPTKAELERQLKKEKLKTDSRIWLIASIFVIAIGIAVLVMTPFMTAWLKVQLQDFKLAGASIPSGYAICGIGLAMQLIDRLPFDKILSKVKK